MVRDAKRTVHKIRFLRSPEVYVNKIRSTYSLVGKVAKFRPSLVEDANGYMPEERPDYG